MNSKLLLITLLSIFSFNLFAQMNISTDLRRDAIWDTVTGEWSIYSTDDEEMTFFEFNKDFTMFKHTTASITSAYIIKSYTYDEELDQYEMDIVSDVGNKYIMIVDLAGDNLRFIYERGSATYMVQHSIKSIWFDDDE